MKQTILTLVMATAAAMAVTAATAAQPQPKAEVGREIAARWCQSCHDISGRTTSDFAPGFRTLAADPALSEARLRGWLKSPHPQMPDFSLSNREIADLIAYIRSLEND